MLSHLLFLLGRLSFIFGGSLFAVVFFRHLPELEQSFGDFLMARRGLILVGSLFALFCVTLELERLGARPDRRCDGHLLQGSGLRLRLRG
jgi:hypothetical protein